MLEASSGSQGVCPSPSERDLRRRMYNTETASLSLLSGCWTAQIFIGISGWLYRQLFAADYITVLKVHWLTITWYSSYTSCFKIFILTKFSGYNLRAIRYNTLCFKIFILTKLSEYNLRAIRYNTSCGKEETQYKSSHGQLVSTSWRGHRHKNLAFTNLVFILVLIFKALWQGDNVSKYKPT